MPLPVPANLPPFPYIATKKRTLKPYSFNVLLAYLIQPKAIGAFRFSLPLR